MNKFILIVGICLLLSGCERILSDQCIKAKLFKECMSTIPQVSQPAIYKDLSEVIESCSDFAYYTSLRKESQVKAECASN